jgi:hypothetical protein
LLFRLAEVAVANPDGIVQEVLFPVMGEQTLTDLLKEYKATNTAYRRKVHTVLRNSYRSHYRRMVPLLLEALDFHSNNAIHRPVIQALALFKKYVDSSLRFYPEDADVPIAGVISAGMHEIIIETDKDGQERLNRINYEICVLQALRDGLRSREIWVSGALKYRNPDDDLPKDFESQAEGLALAREVGDQETTAWLLYDTGLLLLEQHDLADAAARFGESTRMLYALGAGLGVALNLVGLAAVRDCLGRSCTAMGSRARFRRRAAVNPRDCRQPLEPDGSGGCRSDQLA